MTIIKKFDTKEINKPSQKVFLIKVIFLTAIGFFILIILEIWANNTVVTYGDKLESVTVLQKTLLMENQILENEIAKKAALTNIASESAILGFSKSEKLEYIR